MNILDIVLIIICSILAVTVIILLSVILKNKKNEVVEIDGVRYSDPANMFDAVTHFEGDFVLEVGKEYKIDKSGEVKPGIYKILSASSSVKKFNVRLGSFVREYQHNQEVVLKENDTICAVSHTAILR